MIRKISHLIFIALTILISGCIKETYNMDKLSEQIHLSPKIGISAVSGEVTLSDLVDPNDTIVFDQYNFVSIVFSEDSVVNLTWDDFYSAKNMTGLKGPFTQYATIETQTIDIDSEGIFNNIDKDFLFSFANPSITLFYTNSFTFPLKLKLDAVGKRTGEQDVSLELDTFELSLPDLPDQLEISDIFPIDRSNSELRDLISMLPQEIEFSGTAIMDPIVVPDPSSTDLEDNRIIGRLEIEVPLDLRINNLVFTDTLDNFLDEDSDDENSFKPEDLESLQVILNVKNGFPLGLSVVMSLYNSVTGEKNSITVDDILEAAPVNNEGKANGFSETSPEIDLTQEFFDSIGEADKIIFKFTLNTTAEGSKDVKIYSDYKIEFTAALVVKADINLK